MLEHNVQMSFDSPVKVRIIEYAETQRPFIHQDRCIDFEVFLFLLSGEMRIWEEDREYIVKPGNIFFLKSGIHHWGEQPIPAGSRWYYIHFYTENKKTESISFNGYGTYVRSQEFLPKDFNYHISIPKQLKIEYPQMLQKKLDSLKELFHSENALRLVQVSLGVTELFYELYSSYMTNVRADNGDIVTRKLIDYLQRKLEYQVSSSDITEYMHLNYNYLSQIFKAKTGMSITEYHTRLKITEASRLLRESGMNVSEISDSLGYKDPLYFSHVFKRITGISPREYKKLAYGLSR